jgi:hypothetical protein
MRRRPENQFDQPWLILCEGPSDRRFLQDLIAAWGIENKFHVEFPTRDEDGTGGRAKFGRWLKTLHDGASESFVENVKAVLLFSDNDDEPEVSLKELQNQLKQAGFPVPKAEREVARKDGYPATVILLIPPNSPGNLETLFAEAAHNKFGLRDEVNQLMQAAPAKSWGIGKQSKMRLHTMIAATCRKAPGGRFEHHFGCPEEFRFPIDDPGFNEIVEFLAGFGELVSPKP